MSWSNWRSTTGYFSADFFLSADETKSATVLTFDLHLMRNRNLAFHQKVDAFNSENFDFLVRNVLNREHKKLVFVVVRYESRGTHNNVLIT